MRKADQIRDSTFLEVRAKLLEVAATLDRIDRAEKDEAGLAEPPANRRRQLDQAIQILLSGGDDRAERLQRLFSREYEESWRNDFGI